jgi:hypothetical protein
LIPIGVCFDVISPALIRASNSSPQASRRSQAKEFDPWSISFSILWMSHGLTSVTANTPAAEGLPKPYRIEVKLPEAWQPVSYFNHAETEIERTSKVILKPNDWNRLLEPSAELEFSFSVQLVGRYGNESTGPFGTFSFPVADLRKIQWESMDAARLFNLASAINLEPVARRLAPEWCADTDNQRSTLVCGTN